MKRLIGLSVVLSMVFAATSFAATAGPPSWDLLDHDFGTSKDGSMKGNGWFANFTHDFLETVSADSTTLRTDGGGSHQDRVVTQFSPVLDPVGDYTLEVRMRTGVAHRSQANIATSPSNGFELRNGLSLAGAPGFLLIGTGAGIPIRYETPANAGACPPASVCEEFATKFPGIDLSNFNTFRIVQEGGTNTLYLSADGLDDTVQVTTAAGGSGNFIRFYMDTADGRDYTDGEFDYVRVAAGAWSPVPEPATMAMIGLGSLLLLRRRHRA